jgi:hypothetical protein
VISLLTVEHLKAVGYLISGYAAARVWFKKEIALGKTDLAKTLALVKAEIAKFESMAKDEQSKLTSEAKAVFIVLVNRLKSLL